MGKNFNEGGSRVGHVGIKSAFFFPELADAGTLFGFKTGHNTIDVRLMSASMIAARKVVLIYAGEELCGIVVGCSGGRPLRFVCSSLICGSLFFRSEPFRSIGHDARIDGLGFLFHSGNEFGVVFYDVVLLTEILR